jgi:serine/threonine protein kinase
MPNSHQIVHGNLVPHHILIDESGNPKIALPNCQGMSGTPAYIAPETFQFCQLDGRADIWSFGVFMFELLTGTRPFGASSTSFQELIAGRQPIPLRQIDKTLPRDLERICSRCLSKDVEKRYSTASDLAEELRHCRLVGPSLWRWFRSNREVDP